jgi:hypothetical protein
LRLSRLWGRNGQILDAIALAIEASEFNRSTAEVNTNNVGSGHFEF